MHVSEQARLSLTQQNLCMDSFENTISTEKMAKRMSLGHYNTLQTFMAQFLRALHNTSREQSLLGVSSSQQYIRR